MRKKIGTRIVEALKPGEICFDTTIVGFAVRRQSESNRKTYVVKTVLGGRQRLFTIGMHGSPWTVDSARREAKRLLGEVAAGRDPAARRPSRDVATVIEQFFREHVAAKTRASTQREYRRLLDKTIKPSLGRLAVTAVTIPDVEKLHARMRKTPYLANRVLALLSRFFKWCEPRYRDRGTNPARDIERYPEHQRHRDLDAQEIARVAAAMRRLDAELPFAVAALRLLLLTGCRRQEILDLRWDQVRLDQRLLRLPRTKTGSRAIPLNDAAIAILKALPRIDGNPFVICGRHKGKGFVGLGRIWARILDEAKIEKRIGPDGTFQAMRIHDLRHHVATAMLNDGASLAEVGKLLGHGNPQTTSRYAMIRDEAAAKTAARIGALLGPVIG